MPLPTDTPTNMADLSLKELLAEVDAFLDSHYAFRCDPKYKGFFGKFRSSVDKYEEEEREKRHEHALLSITESLAERAALQQELDEGVVFYSGPPPPHVQKRIEEERIKDLEKRIEALKKETFSFELFRFIDAKGKDPVDVYKRANIDRKLFSKIRGNDEYQPSKKTAISLALALELSLSETRTLLERAGFALSSSIMFDVIIEYFISQGKYNRNEINSVLFAYKQALLD